MGIERLHSQIGRRVHLSLKKGLRPGAGAGAGNQSQMPGLLPAAGADAEASLGVAAAGIQAIRAEIVAAFIAAQQALAAAALFAVMAKGNFATFHQVQFAPVDERRLAG
jgi:hypothetical protein